MLQSLSESLPLKSLPPFTELVSAVTRVARVDIQPTDACWEPRIRATCAICRSAGLWSPSFPPSGLAPPPATGLAQSNPTNHVFTLHSTPVIDRNHQHDIRELKEGHLEHKGLFIDRIGLPTNGHLATGHFLTHRIEEKELSICI